LYIQFFVTSIKLDTNKEIDPLEIHRPLSNRSHVVCVIVPVPVRIEEVTIAKVTQKGLAPRHKGSPAAIPHTCCFMMLDGVDTVRPEQALAAFVHRTGHRRLEISRAHVLVEKRLFQTSGQRACSLQLLKVRQVFARLHVGSETNLFWIVGCRAIGKNSAEALLGRV
jgi:hypothetical protein